MQKCGDRTTNAARFVGVIGGTSGHDQATEIGVAQAERPEHVAVLSNLRRRIAGVTNQNFLSDEEDPASGRKSLNIE